MTQTGVTMTVEEIPKGWIKTNLADERYFEIVPSGISEFEGTKKYLSTSSIVGDKIVSVEDEISFEDRPSRANMEPVEGSVWFAKMKGTLKVLSADKDTSQNYVLSTGFCGIKPRTNVSSRFLKQIFLSDKFNSVKDFLSTGSTQQGVGNGDLSMIKILLPTFKEQERIAETLSTIDENIFETDRIVVECEHIKKGLMQILLIKGIPNRHTKFKKTVLGEIPEDWDFKKLTQVCSGIGDGLHSTPNYVDSSEYFFINGNNLIEGSIVITERTKCVNKEEFHKYHLPLSDKTILMSINGTIGNLAYFNNEKVILGKSAAYMNIDDSCIDKNFVFYLLQSPIIKKYYEDELTGTTINNLSLKSVRNTPIPLPSLKEQRQISDIMLQIDERIQTEKTKMQQLIKLKVSLTQKLLSGEIRVRV